MPISRSENLNEPENERHVMSALTDPIDIHVSNPSVLDERLEAAVRQLQGVAMLSKSYGILITRHGPGHYTASLSDRVPFGMTHELLH